MLAEQQLLATAHEKSTLARQRKDELDERLPEMPPWVIHDLRRTARSLMSRANVRPDIAERVLGHKIGGIEGVYDRHAYDVQKAEALNQLAALIESIVNPRHGNVGAQKERVPELNA